MYRFFGFLLAGCLCLAVFGCTDNKNVNAASDPMNVLPSAGNDETDAKTWEVPAPKPRREHGETVYPLLYGSVEVFTKNRAEWERWLRDPSLAPLPNLQDDRSFVLKWCRQFSNLDPEDAALFLMNYFEYDYTFTHMQPTWHYSSYPEVAFFDWYQLRRAIVDKKLVCAGYAQFFYLIVKERYPDVQYITSDEICHARNYFEGEHWDITWLDEEGVDYNPDKIKFDFVGMQKRISRGYKGNVGNDWKTVNLVEGERPW
ncbi:MAG: hypothetical protein Pg6C_04630 [Treponemataceae bacterium]|nr:MAG: hypothetical protein Pg6C_04630 [Treponemataceae bacterium]